MGGDPPNCPPPTMRPGDLPLNQADGCVWASSRACPSTARASGLSCHRTPSQPHLDAIYRPWPGALTGETRGRHRAVAQREPVAEEMGALPCHHEISRGSCHGSSKHEPKTPAVATRLRCCRTHGRPAYAHRRHVDAPTPCSLNSARDGAGIQPSGHVGYRMSLAGGKSGHDLLAV